MLTLTIVHQVFPDLVRATNEREVQGQEERWNYVLSALSLPHHILALSFCVHPPVAMI